MNRFVFFSLILFLFATLFLDVAATATTSLAFFLIVVWLAIVSFKAGTTVFRIDNASAHFVGGLAAFLGKDNLEGVALDDEMIHFVARLTSLNWIGVLDKGESFRLLIVIVARNVNVAQIPDPAKGLVEILAGHGRSNITN
jgi:hypothetical protein